MKLAARILFVSCVTLTEPRRISRTNQNCINSGVFDATRLVQRLEKLSQHCPITKGACSRRTNILSKQQLSHNRATALPVWLQWVRNGRTNCANNMPNTSQPPPTAPCKYARMSASTTSHRQHPYYLPRLANQARVYAFSPN